MNLNSSKSRILFNYTNNIILITDSLGQIIEANYKAGAFLGYTPNELHQKEIISLVSPKDRDKIKDCLARLKANKKNCICYLELLLKSGLKPTVIAQGWGIYHQDNLVQICFFFQPLRWEQKLYKSFVEPDQLQQWKDLALAIVPLLLELNALLIQNLDYIALLKQNLASKAPFYSYLEEIERITRRETKIIEELLQSFQDKTNRGQI